MFLDSIRAAVCAETKARTKLWAELNGYLEKPVLKDQSEKVKSIEKALGSREFGSRGPSYAALMSIIVGEPITAAVVKPAEVGWGAGTIVVPLGNNNSHNYVIGDPVFNHRGGCNFIRPDCSPGNNMTSASVELRPATDDEIDAFFKKAVDKFITDIATPGLLAYPYPAK